jgi:hypothetical protein
MNNNKTTSTNNDVAPSVEVDEVYEAPSVETVLTASDLTREIQYAGEISLS